MNRNLYFATLISSLGGFLFGFDTAVISGTTSYIQPHFGLGDWGLGFTVAVALIGTMAGAVLIGKPGDIWGRKKMLIVTGILYTLSAAGCGLAWNWNSLLLFRFIGGLAVGAASVLSPMYIAEISPAPYRGRLVAVNQFNIVLGILVAFFSNWLLVNTDIHNWRWMFGVEAFPALLFTGLVFFIPESPRWLVKQNQPGRAGEVLQRLGEKEIEHVMTGIIGSLTQEMAGIRSRLWERKYSNVILYAVLLAVFNQLTGINAILYYAPRIFEATGISTDSAFLQAVAVGMTNMVFTVLAMTIIDRFGRKTLLLTGSAGMAACLALVGFSFATGPAAGPGVLVFILCFIAFFAFSQGAVIWVFLSEVFPNSIRAKGQALGTFTHWLMAAAVSWTFPAITGLLGPATVFCFFGTMMILQLLFVWKVLPETRNKSLEELERILIRIEK
ncbi:MAG: sugar porter family MFS transporter [Bacteroidales bacterium]|nr:sugar porter family MFS transporter [Bacteroidales bacterium]